MSSVFVTLLVLLGILGAANLLLTLALARRLAETQRAVAAGPGPEPRMPRTGAEIGPFSLQAIDGGLLTDARLRHGRTLVAFSMAGCPPCAGLAEELQRTDIPPGLGMLVLVVAGEDDREALIAKYPAAADVALVPHGSDLLDRLEVEAFPTVVLVEDGRITAVGRRPGEVLAALAGAPA